VAIALDEELVRLTALTAADSAVCWDRVLFCAETMYKAWFPLTHRWLGFEQANITIDPPMLGHADGTFSAHLQQRRVRYRGRPAARSQRSGAAEDLRQLHRRTGRGDR
jgi:4'-phosphopantetheinyl transferase EntD